MSLRVATRKEKAALTDPSTQGNRIPPPQGKVWQEVIINFGGVRQYTKEEIRNIIGEGSRFF